MENINTWADFAALEREELDALSPEEMDTLKQSIVDNEANLVKAKEEEIAKVKEIAENQRIRAEKAEKDKKVEGEVKKETPELSTKDVLYLAKSDIHEDDLTEVLDWAKFKGISITEAHKAIKTTLDVRKEERKTAEATNTGASRATTKVTGESLLEKARQGQLSDKEEDIDKIVDARMEEKLNRK